MKKALSILAAGLIVLAAAGTAPAFFEDGNAYQVVYQATGNSVGNEVAYDLGALSGLTFGKTWNEGIKPTDVGATDWSKVWVGVVSSSYNAGTGNTAAYLSQNKTGSLDVDPAAFFAFNSSYDKPREQYVLQNTQKATLGKSANESYWTGMNESADAHSAAGYDDNFLHEVNLAALNTPGASVELFWYGGTQTGYRRPSEADMALLGKFVMSLDANGGLVKTYQAAGGPVVPIPAPVFLLASGLVGLVGIRRRRNA